MKKIILFIILLYLISHLHPQTLPIPAAGSGTINDPYQIANLANLRWLSETPSLWGAPPKYFLQTANIDASETRYWDHVSGYRTGFTPIGDYTNPFGGFYDGQRFTIDNLYIYMNYIVFTYISFIGRAHGATLKNIILIDNDFNGHIEQIYYNNPYAGGILGYGTGNTTISNCYTTGNISLVSPSNVFTGGIAGWLEGSITNCFTMGNIDVTLLNTYSYNSIYLGGIVGYGEGSISNCYSTGDITAISRRSTVGGILGSGMFNISNCFSTGNITATYDELVEYESNEQASAGGICGGADGPIINCFSTGNITAIAMWESASAGGIAAWNNHSITNSYSIGNVTARVDNTAGWYHEYSWAGGILGMGEAVINCYAKGYISSQVADIAGYAGGISASTWDDIIHSNCFWDIETTGQTYATAIGTPETNYGLTTIEMKNIINYLNSGWNFDNIWGMANYINDGYPYLKYTLELTRPISNLTAEISENNVILNWDAPEGLTYPLLGYIVIRNQTSLTPEPIIETTITDCDLEDGVYNYIVFAAYLDGYSIGVVIQIVINSMSISEEMVFPIITGLQGNYPNPFNPSTCIKFSLSVASILRIDIYNIKGQKIRSLVDGYYHPGSYSVDWDGTDSQGSSVSSGIYFYKMMADDYVGIGKMMMVK